MVQISRRSNKKCARQYIFINKWSVLCSHFKCNSECLSKNMNVVCKVKFMQTCQKTKNSTKKILRHLMYSFMCWSKYMHENAFLLEPQKTRHQLLRNSSILFFVPKSCLRGTQIKYYPYNIFFNFGVYNWNTFLL